MRNPKTYTKDFKLHVCKLVLEKNTPVPQLAIAVKVPSHTIYRWIKEYQSYGEDAFAGSGYLRNPDAKLKRLEKINKELQAEINLLKKAQAYFASLPKNGSSSSKKA